MYFFVAQQVLLNRLHSRCYFRVHREDSLLNSR